MDISQVWPQLERLIADTRTDQRVELVRRLQRWLATSTESGDVTFAEVLDDTTTNRLTEIAEFLRSQLPVDAVLPSENFVLPTAGENADCNPSTTVHLDAFLYPENEIDHFWSTGLLSRAYCTQCGSKKTLPMTLITHSASSTRARFIARIVKTRTNLSGKTIVDVGSRLGVLCYAAYFMTPAARIVGVELNADFCELQRKVVEKFAMTDRIQIVNADIMQELALLEEAQVVLMNNPFEFFSDETKQRDIWKLISKSCRKGCLLVTVPSLEETFTNLKILPDSIDLSKWVQSLPISEDLEDLGNDEDEVEVHDVHLYRVLQPVGRRSSTLETVTQ